jgi:ppGpp synthetase/RelA/SpoT-type nucleotidyltranferase
MKTWRLMAHHQNPVEAVHIYSEEGFIAIGWGHTGELQGSNFTSHQEITKQITSTWPDAHNAGQGGRVLWGFIHELSRGDYVIVSVPGRRMLVMEVTGDYFWEPSTDDVLLNYQHRRPAKVVDIDPDELWTQHGGIKSPWNSRWTLGLCVEIPDSLTRIDIAELIARYTDERPKFEKLVSEIQHRVANRLRDKGIRNMVTARAKAPDSLNKKLWKERAERSMQDFESSLSPPLKDLAAVRVLLYLPEDTQPTVETLREMFHVRQDKSYKRLDGYRAEHLYICLEPHEDDIDAELQSCYSLLCEIQICTITDHIWNVLEHDIIYKQPGGQPDEGQKELLISLHHMLGIASQAVDRLMKRTKARSQKMSEPILEPEGLQVYLSRRFGEITVRGDFDSLLGLLGALMAVVSPAALDKLFEDGWKEAKAKREAKRLDPNGSERDLGWISLILLPVLGEQEILDVTEQDELPPLLKMMRRAAERHIGGNS